MNSSTSCTFSVPSEKYWDSTLREAMKVFLRPLQFIIKLHSLLYLRLLQRRWMNQEIDNIFSYFILLEQKCFEGYLPILKHLLLAYEVNNQPYYTRYWQNEAPVLGYYLYRKKCVPVAYLPKFFIVLKVSLHELYVSHISFLCTLFSDIFRIKDPLCSYSTSLKEIKLCYWKLHFDINL
jgi:hypothetical protein